MKKLTKSLASLILIAGIASLLSPACVLAEVYKCKDEAGRLMYSDKKCSDNSEPVKIKKHKQLQRQRPPSTPFYCPSGITAVVNNLHYPTLKSINEAIRITESDYTSLRYRKLIKRVDPSDVLPDRVSKIRAEAFHASDVPGFSNGIVVNVKICK